MFFFALSLFVGFRRFSINLGMVAEGKKPAVPEE